LGLSYSRGHNSAGIGSVFNPSNFITNLYGADATLRWKPLRRAIYNSLLFRTDFFWSNAISFRSSTPSKTQHAFGMYSSADYR